MFARVSALLLAVPLLVAATAVHRGGGPVVDQCNTGSIQCCDSLQHASSVDPTSNLGLLAGVLSGLTGQIGSGCIDIPIIGAKNGCANQVACCDHVIQNSLVGINCSPINLNL